MRKFFIGIGVFLLIAIAFLILGPLGLNNADAETTTMDSATIATTTLTTTIGSTGSISAARSLGLSFEVNGRVNAVNVAVGDDVTEGQVLATMDDSDLRTDAEVAEQSLAIAQMEYDTLIAGATEDEIARAEADVASAQMQLDNALIDESNVGNQLLSSCSSLDRATTELDTAQAAYDSYLMDGYEMDATFTPDLDSTVAVALDDAQTSFDLAQAQCTIAESNSDVSGQVNSAQTNLDEAQRSLADLLDGPDETEVESSALKLRQAQLAYDNAEENVENASLLAPFDGVVTAVDIIEGQNVSGTTDVLTIADTSHLYMTVQVDENDVIEIEPEQSATIELNALQNVTIPGAVTRISPAGTSSQGLVTYDVQIELDLSASQNIATAPAFSNQAQGGFAPGQTPATNGTAPIGDNPTMQQLFPLIQQVGGFQALNDMLATQDGEAPLMDMIAELDGGADLIASIEESGGLSTVFADLPAPQAGGGFAQNGNTAANTQDQAITTNTSVSSIPIRIGMTADVEIITETLPNVLVVPSRAIQREGRETYLLVDNGDGAENALQVPVTVGQTINGQTVVEGDISDGQTIYMPVVLTTTTTDGADPAAAFGGLPGGGDFPAGGVPGGGFRGGN